MQIISQLNHQGHRRRIKQKYQQSGLSGWHDYEIMEFILTFALPRKDTKPIAKALIQKFQTLSAVLDATRQELQEIDGLSEHSVMLLKLFKDIAIIYHQQALQRKNLLNAPQLVVDYLTTSLKGSKNEQFAMLFLDNRHHLIAIELFDHGTVNQTVVFPRQVVEHALHHHAVSVIISHNHPAGSLHPSSEDINLTHAIASALKTVDIKLLDHIIIGGKDYFSFKEKGMVI